MLMSSEVWVIPKFLDLIYDTVSIRVGHPLLGIHYCVLGGCGDGGCGCGPCSFPQEMMLRLSDKWKVFLVEVT